MRTIGGEGHRVKPRSYDSSARKKRADESRDRILDAAESAFLERGYATPTVASIAATAGVSVDTIYKSFGGKPGLVRAIHSRALRGERDRPAEERSDQVQAEEPDPRRIVAAWGRFTAELSPRAAPIALLVRSAAATDPELAALAGGLDRSRLERMTANAGRLHAAGHLRAGITVEKAATVLWTYSAPELYELLVLRRGIDLDEYAAFIGDSIAAALL